MPMDMNFLKDHIYLVAVFFAVFVVAFMWLRPSDKVQSEV